MLYKNNIKALPSTRERAVLLYDLSYQFLESFILFFDRIIAIANIGIGQRER